MSTMPKTSCFKQQVVNNLNTTSDIIYQIKKDMDNDTMKDVISIISEVIDFHHCLT